MRGSLHFSDLILNIKEIGYQIESKKKKKSINIGNLIQGGDIRIMLNDI